MDNNSLNNKRIAKNTILLYVRLLFSVLVGLFTSRVVLQTLGIDDYGVYNVVAGVVTMFSMVTNSLGAAISRFFTFSLGRNEKEKLSTIFSTSLNIMIGISILIAILMEIIGVWVLNTYLNIPHERMIAANWVFQFSIISFCIGLINSPYSAAIVAHERMSVYAYVSILEVLLRLIIVYLLYVSPLDKLITYSFLTVVVSVLIRVVYGIYCSRNLDECRYRFVWDKTLLKEMTGFAGWNFMGSASVLLNNQGVNIITNIYFNVAANAARGVAGQIDNIIKNFATNFTVAINPQITKSYASGNIDYTYSLICRSSKFCFLLLLLFSVPFMFEAETIMHLWLGEYPQAAPLFLRLSLVITMMDLLGNSPAIAAWATGNVKRYYIYVGTIVNFMLPLSWIAFAVGLPAYASYVIGILVYTLTLVTKLFVIKGLIGFSPRRYLYDVVMPIAITTFFAIIVPGVIHFTTQSTILNSIIVVFVGLLCTAISTYVFGLTKEERKKINSLVLSKYHQVKSQFHY